MVLLYHLFCILTIPVSIEFPILHFRCSSATISVFFKEEDGFMSKDKRAAGFAVLAAALYAVSSPVSKLLLQDIPPAMMAALLYLGAGAGMLAFGLIRKGSGRGKKEQRLTRRELPYTIGMIVLDIAAPFCLMFGLRMTSAANASLLNNFEIVATSLIALLVFKEKISARLWTAIGLVTVSSIILSVEDVNSFSFSIGSVLVLLACICWGFENNCTRMLSCKNPLEIVIIKGFGSGSGSLLLAFATGERVTGVSYIAAALLLGFAAYGLSIFFYVYAQRELGAAKTSAYYAVAPFIGVLLSLVMFRELPPLSFFIALLIMIAGVVLTLKDQKMQKEGE